MLSGKEKKGKERKMRTGQEARMAVAVAVAVWLCIGVNLVACGLWLPSLPSFHRWGLDL